MGEYFGPDALRRRGGSCPSTTRSRRARKVAFSTVPASSCGDGYARSSTWTTTPTLDLRRRSPRCATRSVEFLGGSANSVGSDGDQPRGRDASRPTPRSRTRCRRDSQQFNRRALIIVGNRQLRGQLWRRTPDPPGRAVFANAFMGNDSIFTYVAALDAPAGHPGAWAIHQTAGGNIASAGGTSLYDATTGNEAEGAEGGQRRASTTWAPASTIAPAQGHVRKRHPPRRRQPLLPEPAHRGAHGHPEERGLQRRRPPGQRERLEPGVVDLSRCGSAVPPASALARHARRRGPDVYAVQFQPARAARADAGDRAL